MHEPSPDESLRDTPRGPVDELVAEVLNGAPDSIQERLEETCREHPQHASVLRRRVEILADAGFVEPGAVELPDRLGEFELIEPIGEGGMGVVYRARQESLERDVAVKLIRPGELRFAGARERFAREVTTVARLSHPGIVPVYAVGEEGGIPYFAMELVRGETLAELLTLIPKLTGTTGRGEDLDRALAHALGEPPAADPAPLFRGTWEETSLRIVRAVAAALDHAHGSNILHRDLKPSNIMLTRDGRVMLLDFGLSSVEGSERLTRTGVQVGSFAYMAPELLTDVHSADRRSDVYSLGVTLYELLAGRLPYRAGSLAGLRNLVLQAHPRPLRRGRARRVSWEAETVCLVAMDVDRARRYATAGELAHDLDNVLSGQPIKARRPGFVLRTRRLAGRHPAWTTGIALLAIAIPVTWAVQERLVRVQIAREKARTDRINVALAESLEEVKWQEARADANFVLARDAVDRMLDRLGDVRMRDVPHLETLRRDVLKDALAFHEALVDAEPEDPGQRLHYARSLRRVAEMHSLLSEFDEVCAALERAAATIDELIEAGGDERHYDELGQIAWRRVEAESYRNRLDDAVRVGREARERLLTREVDPPRARLRLARLDLQLARALQRAGGVEEAREILVASVESLRELRSRDELNDDGAGLLATELAVLGEPQTYMVHGDREEDELAIDAGYLQEALELRRAIAAEEPSPDSRFAVVEALNSLAGSLFSRSRSRDALTAYLEGREIVEQLTREFPSVLTYQDALAAIDLNAGSQYLALGEPEEAERALERADTAYATLHRARPNQRGLGVRRLIAIQSLIVTRHDLGKRSRELLERVDQVEALGEQLARTETGQGAALVKRLLPRMAHVRGNTLFELGGPDEALDHARALAEPTDARTSALFQAAAILCVCVQKTAPGDEQRSEYAYEAVDYLARALDQEMDRQVVEGWLAAEVLQPLRAEPVFVELLESRGLEAWLTR